MFSRNTISGGEGNDSLSGGIVDDLMVGGEGNDTLDSNNGGNDTLTGGSGADEFLLSSSKSQVVTISDFESAIDKIVLQQGTSVFGELTPTEDSFLEPSQFSIVDNDVAVGSSSGFITYSLETGNLFYNQNGTEAGLGDGSKFATLQGIPPLAETDFIIT